MGNSAGKHCVVSSAAAAPGVEAATEENFEEGPCSRSPILTLPSELVVELGKRLTLPALSSLACACRELHESLPDALWRPLLEQALRSAAVVLERLPLLSTTSISGPAHPAAQLHEEDSRLLAFTEAARGELEENTQADQLHYRQLCAQLAARSCVLCHQRGISGAAFPLTARGVCLPCLVDRPVQCERWRRRQAAREEGAREAVDERERAVLVGWLGVALLERLGGRAIPRPRLIFDSARSGSSLAALLRAADHAPASLLVMRERLPSEGARTSMATRTFGAFISMPWVSRRGPAAGRAGGFFGDARCFLFSISPGREGRDTRPLATTAST